MRKQFITRASLDLLTGSQVEKRFPLLRGKAVTFGRGRAASLRLEDPELSRLHFAATLNPDTLIVTDLGSSNGTWLDGVRLPAKVPSLVSHGQKIRAGIHTFQVSITEAQAPKRPVFPEEEFEILSSLGSGASATVWAVRERLLDRVVAIKVLGTGIDQTSPKYQRFLLEAKLCSRIKSPNLVELYGVRLFNGSPCLIMEFIDGVSLRERLTHSEMLISEILQAGERIARALHAISEEGIVHRDVKPDNILLAPQGTAKLIDLGIAKDLTAPGQGITIHAATGPGSPPYCAPEQLTTDSVDARTDIYGLGSTLYHAIAGHPPFLSPGEGPPPIVVLTTRIRFEPPAPLLEARPECPPELAVLVERMLAKAPDERPQSARILAETFKSIRESLQEEDENTSLEETLRGSQPAERIAKLRQRYKEFEDRERG